jgi:glycosyltransferase involved in cell wall biosynthesis
MDVLIVIPYARYFSDIATHLTNYFSGPQGAGKATVTTVVPPRCPLESRTIKFLNKMEIAMTMLFNYFCFFYRFVIRGKKQDVVILANQVVAIPYLFLAKIFPFLNGRKNTIVMSFFLHELGEKNVVKKILRFLFSGKRVLLIVQSGYEAQYYSQLMDKSKVVQFPFCQHEVAVTADCGKGEEYIFAGGHTNRDYECLLETARRIKHNYIIICSRSYQQIDELSRGISNVRILKEASAEDFNGYLKNAKIVIIPLKEKTGASGQMVALAAMLFRKPVVYTNIDSVSQYFENGVSGLPYEINNAKDLADKIQRLLADPQLRKTLGDNAFNEYYKKYHISNYCKSLAELILK